MKSALFVCVFTFLFYWCHACSCAYTVSFCERVVPGSEVLSVRILEGYFNDYYHYIDVEYVEHFQGEGEYEKLTLRTGGSTSCDPLPDMFEAGDTLVFIKGEELSFTPSAYPAFGLSYACGSSFRLVRGGEIWQVFGGDMVVGVPYAEYLENFEECVKLSPLIDFARDIDIYPNPTSTELSIYSTPQFDIDFQIFSASGQLLLSSSTGNQFLKTVDVSDFPTGLYFLRFTHDGERSVERFVVN